MKTNLSLYRKIIKYHMALHTANIYNYGYWLLLNIAKAHCWPYILEFEELFTTNTSILENSLS